MNVLQFGTYPMAEKALAGDTDVAVLQNTGFTQKEVEAYEGSGGSRIITTEDVYCHIMTLSDELASEITEKLGWKEVNRSHGYICLIASKKRAAEVILSLKSLAYAQSSSS